MKKITHKEAQDNYDNHFETDTFIYDYIEQQEAYEKKVKRFFYLWYLVAKHFPNEELIKESKMPLEHRDTIALRLFNEFTKLKEELKEEPKGEEND